jgi:hypothetical protein
MNLRIARIHLTLLLALAGSVFIGCAAPDAPPTTNAAAPPSAASSVSSAPAAPVAAPVPVPQSGFGQSLEEPDDDLLIDFRRSLNLDPPKLSASERLQALRAVYGAKASVENVTINGMRTGSFTRPNAKETLYVMQEGGPVAADPTSLERVTLAVLSQGRLVAKVQTDAGNFILRLSDIDLNGVNEALLSRSFFNMGTLTLSASLVDFTDGKLTKLKDFGRVYENSCEGGAENGAIVAAELRARAENGMWKFAIKGFRGDCSATKDPRAFREAPEEKLGEGPPSAPVRQ